MKLQRLTIGPDSIYRDIGPDNPYQATIEVEYIKTEMKVVLGQETCVRILDLVRAEIAAAAQVQIDDFVREAISGSKQAVIEGKSDD